MRTNTKTRLGLIAAGTGVAALTITGLALPANAEDTTSVDQAWTTETTESMTEITSSLDAFQTWVSESLNANGSGNDVTLVEGPLVGGDVLSGPIGSGNQAPVGSGNDTPIGSGNDVSAPVGSGNDTSVEAPVDAPVGSGNDVSAGNGNSADGNASGNETGNGNDVGSGNESSTDAGIGLGDIGADVDNLVDDVTGDLGLGDILG
jgi:hypothetical protein